MSSSAKSPRLDWMNPQSDNLQTVHQATDRYGIHYRIVTALAMNGAELVSWLTITSADDEGKRTTLRQGRYASTQGSKIAAAAWSRKHTPESGTVEQAHAKVAEMAAELSDEALSLAWTTAEQEPYSAEIVIVRDWLSQELNKRLGDDLFDEWLFAYDEAGDPISPIVFLDRKTATV